MINFKIENFILVIRKLQILINEITAVFNRFNIFNEFNVAGDSIPATFVRFAY